MSILVDLEEAIEAYPHEFLTLEIVEVDFPGNAINAGDDVQFRIQVANGGPLDLLELSLLVEGLNGTEVKSNGAAAQWTTSFTFSGISSLDKIPAHSANDPYVTTGNKLHFRPGSSSTSVKDLVRVSIAGWDTDFTHMQVSHSRADALAEATYSSTVAPS